MKKLTIGIIVILVLILCSVYVFIPSKIEISGVSTINCIPKVASNSINDSMMWEKWWPNKSSKHFSYNGYEYELINPLTDGAEITIKKNETIYQTKVLMVPVGRDSTTAHWFVSYSASMNPLKRIRQRKEAVTIKNNLDSLLERLKNFAGETRNIYGFHIERGTFPDTILAATKFVTVNYPTIQNIYDAINKIKTVIAKQGAKEKGSPMLNIERIDSLQYETMLAIPIDRELNKELNVATSIMLTMKDRFLFTEVIGGPVAIQKAHEAINKYMLDHVLTAPAIPFDILITDRSKQGDTSKWRTTIYYPSM